MDRGRIHYSEDRAAESSWYAVHCKPYKEYLASRALIESLGLVVYLPEIRSTIGKIDRRTPLFPGYLFVEVNHQQAALSAINRVPGVQQLVEFGGEAPRIPTNVIDSLRQRVDDLNHSGGLLAHPFREGQPLRFKAGPLRGLEAIFLGPTRPRERIRVLIDFLGSLREAEVDVYLVESVSDQRSVHQERRSRGRGRPIKLKH